MKRKFLAKAITLGLMLAVPFGVEAGSITLAENTVVDENVSMDWESNKVFGDGHNYTINGVLSMNSASIKEVDQLTFGVDGATNEIKGNTVIEANNITVKGGLSNLGNASMTTSGKLFISDNSEKGDIKVYNSGKITAGSIESTILFRNSGGVINVDGELKATKGFRNEKNSNKFGTINAGSLSVEKEFSNEGTITASSIEANLDGNITNNAGATIQANKIEVISGGIRNEGTLTSTTEINSVGGVYNKGSLTTNKLVSKDTVTNGGFNNGDEVNPNSKMEVASLTAEAIINNAQLTADSIETELNIRNGENAKLNVNETLKIDGILKNDGSLETKDLIISQTGANATMDSYSKGELKVKNNMTLNENANFEFQEGQDGSKVSIKNLKTNGNNTINIGKDVTGISVGTLDGKNTTISVASDDAAQINIGTNNDAGLTIKGSGAMTDSYGDDIAGGLNKLKDTVGIAGGNKNTTLKLASGSVTGEVTGYTNKNGDVTGYTEDANEYNAGISEMASIGLMAWRAENNDMNKRLGELRSSQGEHGVWTRMVRGQSKYGAQNVKNQYSTYQLGYDEKLSVDKHWTVGAAVSYTDASSSFTTGSGKNKSTGLAVYGSYLGDNGSFVDLIAKVARLKNEFDVLGGAGKGDYETNGYSISAEYGKRFTKDNGFWIEPQVELTYGYVGAVDYLTSNDVSVRQNGMDSLVGRVGFSLGRDIKAGNVYARASYLYDFDGETDVTFSKGGAVRGYKQDLGGSWWEVGVGTNINLSDATHLYFDVEKTYGGNVATPWQWNAGVRWSF